MKENEACWNKTNTVIQQLKAINHLEYLGTRAESTYLAEKQFGAGVAAYGVGFGHNRVYKVGLDRPSFCIVEVTNLFLEAIRCHSQRCNMRRLETWRW